MKRLSMVVAVLLQSALASPLAAETWIPLPLMDTTCRQTDNEPIFEAARVTPCEDLLSGFTDPPLSPAALSKVSGGAQPAIIPAKPDGRIAEIILWDEWKTRCIATVEQGGGAIKTTITLQGNR